jgi:hypothetical protein
MGDTTPRAGFGGSKPKKPTSRYENPLGYGLGTSYGSHTPLDIEPHWDWRNPLNVIPAIILLIVALAIIAILV